MMADLRWIFSCCLWVLFLGAAGAVTASLTCTEEKSSTAIEGQPVCISFPIDGNTSNDDTYTIKKSSTCTSEDDTALFDCQQSSGCENFTDKWTMIFTPGDHQFKMCAKQMTPDHIGSYRLENQAKGQIVDQRYLSQESQVPQTTDKRNAASKIRMSVEVPLMFCFTVLVVMGLSR